LNLFSVSFILKIFSLKVSEILFLYFIFSAFNSVNTYSQELHLIVEGKDVSENTIIDSIGYKNMFANYKLLEEEINSLHLKFQKIGYIESQLISTTKKNDTVYNAKFSLNKKYYTIYIYYDKNVISMNALERFSENVTSDYFVTTIQESETILNQINSKIAENGQPFTSLKLTTIKKRDANSLQAKLTISTNKKRTIDEIIVKGYEKFPRSYLTHFLNIKAGNDFDLNSIKEKTETLNTLLFTNQTRPPEVLFTKDSTAIYLYLEKKKSNAFDGFLGFGTNETTNKIEFNGYLNLSLINNLNYGEAFSLVFKSDESDQKTFDVDVSLPYLFNTAIGSELSLNIFKKDSTFTTVDQSVNLFYQINDKQKIFTGINAIQSNNLLPENNAQFVEDYNSTFYSIRYEFLKRQYNNILFPINFAFDIRTGFGFRKIENIKEDQKIFSLNSYKIFNLNNKNSVFLRIKSEGILSDSYLVNELFRFGGINTIRGFEENSLLASFYGLLNSEYRYNLSSTIYIHSIIDVAYINNELTNSKEKLFGFGFGFGLITKAGLLKFNYANGKSENQKFKLSNSKIHISLNAKF
jgi:outer membrane protein assembly factor BamA